jgi:hypothetical protein
LNECFPRDLSQKKKKNSAVTWPRVCASELVAYASIHVKLIYN